MQMESTGGGRRLTRAPGASSDLAWGSRPLDVWDLRVASAAAGDDWTEALLQHLDEYQPSGINAMTVFYQGSSGGSVINLVCSCRATVGVHPTSTPRLIIGMQEEFTQTDY